METYLALEISAEKNNISHLRDLIWSMRNGEMDKCRSILSSLDETSASDFIGIENDYGDYLQSIEEISESETGIAAQFVCGGLGFEFAVSLLRLLGKHSISSTILYRHDDIDSDHDESVTLSFANGKVCANGEAFSSYGCLENADSDIESLSFWNGRLTVKFKDRGLCIYHGVDESIYNYIINSGSIGDAFTSQISFGGYEYDMEWDSLDFLLEEMADLMFIDPPIGINECNNGETPLLVATEMGDITAVKMLIEAGAEVNIAGEDSRTLLAGALSRKHAHIAEALRNAGAT